MLPMSWDCPCGDPSEGLSGICSKEGPTRGGVRPPPAPRPRPPTSSHLWACAAGGGTRARGGGRGRTTNAGWQAGVWARPGRGWGPGAREGLARRCWRGGLRGLGKGLEQKCFLFQRLPAWPRLHHSLLINRFLLPSSPTGRPLAPRRHCRTRALPRAAPRPGAAAPHRPSSGIAARAPARSLPHPPPRGGGPWTRALWSLGVRRRATGAGAPGGAPSDAGTGVGRGPPATRSR